MSSENLKDSSYKCSKCGSLEAETGQIRTTGDGLSRYMNLQNQKFGFIACTN